MVAYQWRRCDTSGASCTDVAGATSTTYGLTSADVGSTIRVAVTASNGAGSASASSAQTGVDRRSAAAPVERLRAHDLGHCREGQTLTADHGAWSGATPDLVFLPVASLRLFGGACAPIGGATAATYPVVTADVGSTLRVRVNASNSVGASDYRTRVVAAARPALALRRHELDSPRRTWLRERHVHQRASARRRRPARRRSGRSDRVQRVEPVRDVTADPAWTASTFSIEVVVKPSALPVNKTIWATQTSTLRGWWLNTGPNGIVRMFIGDGSAWRFDSSGLSSMPGTTYHIVATWDGTQARLYVNGALVSTGPAATMATAPTRRDALRRILLGPGQYWPGVIDDASFYPLSSPPRRSLRSPMPPRSAAPRSRRRRQSSRPVPREHGHCRS